jgi:hypothetical protein
MQESYELRNFAAMSAIMTALLDPTITLLELTGEELLEESKHSLEWMTHLLDPHDNYSQYVAALEASRLPCIPFLGKHITSLNNHS